MNQTVILLPAMALAGWTMTVLALLPYQRFKAAFAGQVTADDFKLGESPNVPGCVSIPNRNFMNLLELPVLFYMLCLTVYVTHNSSVLLVSLAWGYVGLRILHSLVHLSYNNVFHRLSVFAASNLVLISLWLVTLLALVN